ncbi:MAG: release factor glutamine methyltransferase [Blastocatellia bacterium]|jgi:release factor glutamine methyltransferase|nr:release factor glutamine methyltransferase [Blastocatellia bacterium]
MKRNWQAFELSRYAERMDQSIAQALLDGAESLRMAGVDAPRREAGLLLASVLVCDTTFLITHREDLLSHENVVRFNDFVRRRAAGEPLQYITGKQAFYELEFEVNKDVLIPRPETELLVETSLGLLSKKDGSPLICDVGTGSGCIAISLLHEIRGARAIGIDISPAALRVASRNAVRHGVGDRIHFVAADAFAALGPMPPFTMIVSNPPYIAEADMQHLQREVRDHEPPLALAGGPDGLESIRRLLEQAPGVLVDGGYFLFEIGFDQSEAVKELIDTQVWDLLNIHPDLQGIPRTVELRKKFGVRRQAQRDTALD